MTERNIYGRGEVDDRIALLHRTSADLNASVRAWADDDGPDANDRLERNLWDATRDQPDPDTHEQKEQPDQ